MAGAFAFYTTYTPLPDFSTSKLTAPKPTRTATYYIDVEPKLTLGSKVLPLDALSVFSVVSKFMGKYPDDWERYLRGISRREYNMVHFTPLMERGDSNSPYSMFDQLTFDHLCFPNGESDVAKMIARMEKEHGLLGLTDVVWNHTANNSKWLEEHPEAGYNLETAPWLESALELDTALLKFGEELEDYGLPTTLRGEDDLKKVIAGVKEHVLDSLDLWQYHVIDVKHDVESAVEHWTRGQIEVPGSRFGSLEMGGLAAAKDWPLKRKADFLHAHGFIGANELGPRFGRTIDAKVGAALLTVLHGRYDSNSDRKAASQSMKDILNELNEPFYQD